MKEKKTSFFSAVAHHNLERFHSETLSWLFNTNPKSAVAFLSAIHNKKDDYRSKIVFNKCYAEVASIDIRLDYKIDETQYVIYIENKLKATEHLIPYEKWHTNLTKKLAKNMKLPECLLEYKKDLSQTEFYYFREQIINPEKEMTFVYLVPNKIDKTDPLLLELQSDNNFLYDFEKINSWTIKKIKNPWFTITYSELANWLNKDSLFENENDQNKIISQGYVEFILNNFPPFIKLLEYDSKAKFGNSEFFKLLFFLVMKEFGEEENYRHYIRSKSSNSNSPLFAIYKRLNTHSGFNNYEYNENSKSKKSPILTNIGMQLQGDTLKYYISADVEQYNDVRVKEQYQTNYSEYVKTKLNQFETKNNRYNTNKTKTFYSLSSKIEGLGNKNSSDIIKIAKELSLKLKDFFIKTNN